jgi:hypothetical protein
VKNSATDDAASQSFLAGLVTGASGSAVVTTGVTTGVTTVDVHREPPSLDDDEDTEEDDTSQTSADIGLDVTRVLPGATGYFGQSLQRLRATPSVPVSQQDLAAADAARAAADITVVKSISLPSSMPVIAGKNQHTMKQTTIPVPASPLPAAESPWTSADQDTTAIPAPPVPPPQQLIDGQSFTPATFPAPGNPLPPGDL